MNNLWILVPLILAAWLAAGTVLAVLIGPVLALNNPVVEWLRSPEGEQWSRARHDNGGGTAPPSMWRVGPGDPGEDPTGRGPIKTSGEEGSNG